MSQQPAQELVPNDLTDRQQLENVSLILIVMIHGHFEYLITNLGFRKYEDIFRLMRSHSVIKLDELIRDKPEASFADENEVVQALG